MFVLLARSVVFSSLLPDTKIMGIFFCLLISRAVSIPVIACGGAGSFSDLRSVISTGASAAAAGSMFVYTGAHKAVLISYPSSLDMNW